ncbi:MAG: DUF3536 domain-containing protein [Syntrophobacteraceae bacterium]
MELQDSAYPYHDWNEKITAQCYAPNGASRILDNEQRIIEIVNNYSKISFNFGPSLLSWLENRQPEAYEAILEADRLSLERFSGHGSAMAQVYNHMIMPLANKRDKYTQIIWGIEDFRRRFQRDPEGMWLPETAVDLKTLEVLAEHGIRFTILAQRQAARVRRIAGSSKWMDVSNSRIDPSRVYLCPLPSGKTINLYFYDGPISQDIAFGDLLISGELFANRLTSAFSPSRDWPQLVHVATDGETFGHHQRHGDMALAYCLYLIESQNLARITNYGEFLELCPATHYVEIFENSSWSCIHGVERWRENCGCDSGLHPGWSQAWRKPLREAMDRLCDTTARIYKKHAARYVRSPWEARNDYIRVVMDRSQVQVEQFFEKHAIKELDPEDKVNLLSLLEMQRYAMLMYTSCGWFFDEVSGIESVQVIQYAARAVQLAERFTRSGIEAEYVRMLERAPSNIHGNAAKVYEMFVRPSRLDLLRVGIHHAVSSLFEDYSDEAGLFAYTVRREHYQTATAGKLKLAMGKTIVSSNITMESATLSFAVMHLGDHNINGGVREFLGEEAYAIMKEEIRSAFDRADVAEVIRLMDKHFGVNNFSLWHLFRDEQRKIINQILEITFGNADNAYRQVYENSHAIMNFMGSLNIPIPKPLSVAAERIINTDLKRVFEHAEPYLTKLENLISEADRWGISIDTDELCLTVTSWMAGAFKNVQTQPDAVLLIEVIERVLVLVALLDLDLDLWRAQNIYFTLGKTTCGSMREKADSGDEAARNWIRVFENLGVLLKVKAP